MNTSSNVHVSKNLSKRMVGIGFKTILFAILLFTCSMIPKMDASAKALREQRLNNLIKMANDGCHFNVDNVSQRYHIDPASSTEEVTSIYPKNWFQNYVGLKPASSSLLPKHYLINENYSRLGYNCFGFATYALWYLNAYDENTTVVGDLLCGRKSFDYNSLVSAGIMQGDVLRVCRHSTACSGSAAWNDHTVMVISYDANGVDVIDANSDGYCTIKRHTISYSTYNYFVATRGFGDTPAAEASEVDEGVRLDFNHTNYIGFKVNRSTEKNGTYTNIASIGKAQSRLGSYVDKTVEPGVTYYYEIVGIRDDYSDGKKTYTSITTTVKDPNAPEISNASITNLSLEGFTVEFAATDDNGIDSAKVLVNSDELGTGTVKTYDAVFANGKYTANVKIKDFDYRLGSYSVNIQVKDKANTTKSSLKADLATALTKKQSVDVANIASSQIGYTFGSNQTNKYANFYGISSSGSSGTYIVQWVMDQAGVSFAGVDTAKSTTSMLIWARDNGIYHRVNGTTWSYGGKTDGGATENYVPTPGDVVIIDTDSKYDDGPDTAGIVVAVSGTSMTVVRCDSSAKKVTSNSYGIADTTQVWGYIHPKYNDDFKITENPSNKEVNAGDKAIFTVKAVGTGLKYQWQKSTDNGVKWSNTSSTGSTTNTLTLTSKVSFNNYMFRCVITDQNGQSVTSSAAKLTVVSVGPTITTQPKSVSAAAGTGATFSVVASGDGLTYQWMKSVDNGASWVKSGSTGATTNKMTLTAKISFNNYMFKCVITDKNGKKVTSSAAKLTVTSTGPTISAQPKSVSETTGTIVNFSVTATGDGLTYQWMKSVDNGASWVKSGSTGATTNKMTLTAKVSFNNYQFKCVVTDKNGKSVTSTAAKLTVSAASTSSGPVISTQPKNASVQTLTDAVFTVKATGEGLTYQWMKCTDGSTWVNSGSSGAKTATLTISSRLSMNGMKLKCVVTDKNGKTVTSNVVVLSVKQ